MCKVNDETIKRYMVKEDMSIFESFANNKNCNFSFREAGTETVKCLLRGAGAKPHSILEKTIKDSSDQNIQAVIDKFFSEFKEQEKAKDLLKGLVGHWGKELSIIDGIYLTKLGKKVFEERKSAEVNTKYHIQQEGKNYYLDLSTSNDKDALIDFYEELTGMGGKKELNENTRNYLFTRLFFSGDYDMHDFWQLKTIVPSQKDMDLIKDLQVALYLGRQKQIMTLCCSEFTEKINIITDKTIEKYAKKILPELMEEKGYESDYYRVQHGPQYNYIAQMVNDNICCTSIKDINNLIDKVARPDVPVLMYFRNLRIWKNVVDDKALKSEYAAHNITIKETWADSDMIEKHKLWIAQQMLRIYQDKYKTDKNRVAKVLNKDTFVDTNLLGDESYKDLVTIRKKLMQMYAKSGEDNKYDKYSDYVKQALNIVYS